MSSSVERPGGGRSVLPAEPPGEMFVLRGSSTDIGLRLGRLCAPVLRERVRDMLRLARRNHIPETTLLARARDLLRTVRRVAPSWADEAAGLAAGAGLDIGHVLMLNTPPPGVYRRAGAECTSFVMVGAKQNVLLKIRDERNRIQQVVTVGARGRPFLQLGREIGNLGAAHAINAYALALGCNTGSHLVPREDDAGRFNDCLMLRYFAERARRVEDIPPLYERLADAGVAGGAGADRGAIFLAVDPVQGLMLETGWDAAHPTWIRRGLRVASNHFLSRAASAWASQPPGRNTLLRLQRMKECLAEGDRPPALRRIFAITRDRRHAPHALCNDDRRHFWMTNSAWLHVIPRDRVEESVSYVCCGNTRQSIFLPLPTACRANWMPWVSGDFYRAADWLYRARRCRPSVPGRLRGALEQRGVTGQEPPVVLWREALALLRGADVR